MAHSGYRGFLFLVVRKIWTGDIFLLARFVLLGVMRGRRALLGGRSWISWLAWITWVATLPGALKRIGFLCSQGSLGRYGGLLRVGSHSISGCLWHNGSLLSFGGLVEVGSLRDFGWLWNRGSLLECGFRGH